MPRLHGLLSSLWSSRVLSPALASFLFTLALTALIIRSLVRFAQAPRTNPTFASSLWRLVILVMGAILSLSFVLECLRQVKAF